jgi:hypothetical protein
MAGFFDFLHKLGIDIKLGGTLDDFWQIMGDRFGKEEVEAAQSAMNREPQKEIKIGSLAALRFYDARKKNARKD